MNAQITRENAFNADNAAFAKFLKEEGVKGFSRVTKANRDAAEAALHAHFATLDAAASIVADKAEAAKNAEGATNAGTAPSAWAFPKSTDFTGDGGALVVAGDAVAGWDKVDTSTEDDEQKADGATEETDEEAAARIEAEANAEKEAEETEEAKAARKARAEARASNSLGVALSWRDPEVRQARLTRDGVSVTVEGVTSVYKSVAEAFRAHRLPFEKHIKFRLALKASRKEVFKHGDTDYVFEM